MGHEYKNLTEFPKFSSARLHQENHCGIMPCCSHGEGNFSVSDGWELVGWSDAAWKNVLGRDKAVVFEKSSPSNEDMFDTFGHLEPGFYWVHCEPELLNFRVDS